MYKERDGNEDRKPDGKTRRVKEIWTGRGRNTVEEWLFNTILPVQMIGKARGKGEDSQYKYFAARDPNIFKTSHSKRVDIDDHVKKRHT